VTNVTANNIPFQTPSRRIGHRVEQAPVLLFETTTTTAAPDINFEGVQINMHEGFMVQVVGLGTVGIYGRLREDLPWVLFDTLVNDELGTLKNYWGLPLLAARCSVISGGTIQVWGM
jgi:hypothetical protein